MTRPFSGLMCFHQGRPVELLHLVESHEDSETWFVRPLFVAGADRLEVFLPDDILRPLHIKFHRSPALAD